jgi:nitroreductase
VWAREIDERFGGDVAELVLACSEDDDWSMGSWQGRKASYLAHLASPAMPERAVLVSAADKLHNARSTLLDLHRIGDRLWGRFHAGREGQLWYYEQVVDILAERLPGPLSDELADIVAELRSFPDGPATAVTLLDGLATTRAIRRFRPDPIPTADLNRILFAATRAPSGSNRQPFRFVVLTDGPRAQAAKRLLGEAFRQAWNGKRAHDGYDRADSSGSGDLSTETPKARMARAMQQFVDQFEMIPAVVLPCLVRYRAPTPTEGASIYPACQNLLLAARALGYGGVMTEWHMFVDRELHELLDIPAEVFIAATIPLGRPEGGHGPVRRRPVAELVFEDGWEQPAPWASDPPGTRHAGGPPSRRG